jgi:hypothetical protein
MAQFQKGQSGNRKGRPKGTGNAAKIAQAVSDADLKRIITALVEQAVDGNVQAAGLLLARTIPPLKATTAPINLALAPDASLSDKAHTVLDSLAAGQLPPDVGIALLSALGTTARIIETTELEQRIIALEQRHAPTPD